MPPFPQEFSMVRLFFSLARGALFVFFVSFPCTYLFLRDDRISNPLWLGTTSTYSLGIYCIWCPPPPPARPPAPNLSFMSVALTVCPKYVPRSEAWPWRSDGRRSHQHGRGMPQAALALVRHCFPPRGSRASSLLAGGRGGGGCVLGERCVRRWREVFG